MSRAARLVEDALATAGAELAAGRATAACTVLDAIEVPVRTADDDGSLRTPADALAIGRYHLARHHTALAAGRPEPRHARAAVRTLRRAARGPDPEGRANALLAEAAVACCAGAGFLLRAQMIVIAERAARAALAKRPDLGEAHAALGVLALNIPRAWGERARSARRHLEEAVRAQPGRLEWRVWLARAHQDAGELEEARKQLGVVRSILRPDVAAPLIASILGEDDLRAAPPRDEAAAGAAAASDTDPRGNEPAILAIGLRRGYGTRAVLRGVDVVIQRGEVVGLVGPNGAGKTTLLGAIAGRVALEGGSAEVLGERVRAGRMPAGLGYAPQNAGLYPLLTVREHLVCFARLHGLAGRTLDRRVAETLAWSGLGERSRDLARTLSGGMRRRLVVALAAIHAPPALLLDEPMTGIDEAHRERIRAMLRERASGGAAIVCAAPSFDDLARGPDRIVELVDGIAVSREAVMR